MKYVGSSIYLNTRLDLLFKCDYFIFLKLKNNGNNYIDPIIDLLNNENQQKE